MRVRIDIIFFITQTIVNTLPTGEVGWEATKWNVWTRYCRKRIVTWIVLSGEIVSFVS